MKDRSPVAWAIPLACTCIVLLISGALIPTRPTRATDLTATITVFLPAVMRDYLTLPPTHTVTAAVTISATVTNTPTATATSPGPTSTLTTAPGVCLCYADLYNCGDFSTQASAQACFDYCYPTKGDIHRLDGNNDLVACESLP